MEDRGQRAERAASGWQRQAARLLRNLAYQNAGLPGPAWAISPVGLLSGRTGRAIKPGDGREVFGAWRDALKLGRLREVPGRLGRPGSLHASGNFRAVIVTLDARVLPPGPEGPGAGDGPGAFGHGYPLTRHYLPAVVALGNLLEVHAHLPVITWQVGSPGALTGHVSLTASRRGGKDVLDAWRDALTLVSCPRMSTLLAVRGDFAGLPVTITLGMPGRRPPQPARGGASRLSRGRRIAQRPTLLPKLPQDSTRPGPSQRP